MCFWSGNAAIVEAAESAGARFFSGYPITPASSIMEAWSKKAAENKNLIFLQSEDELAAIHSLIGAAIGGIGSFTATSGPGLSLMQEGLGLAFAYSAPIVVVDVQRSGPSTGRPTRAGQGEIMASRFGTHGDFFPFVFYPNSVEQCFRLTVQAFEIANRYQTPVIILSDAYLANLMEKVNVGKDLKKIKFSCSRRHFSGLVSRKEITQKIQKLKKAAENNFRNYQLVGNKNANKLIIAMGSVSRALMPPADDYQIFIPLRIWPILDKELVSAAKGKKKIIVVEMNQGQYVSKVKEVLGQNINFVNWQEDLIDPQELARRINEI